MKILTRTEFKGARDFTPKLSIGNKGLFRLNRSLLELLAVQATNKIIVVKDEESNEYYIGKTELKGGFALRKAASGQLLFNCSGLMKEMRDTMDLALYEGQKSTVKMDVESAPVEHEKHLLYKIF